MSQERLDQIQAEFNTSKAVISEIVKNFAGQKITNLERIIAGEANEVYAISTDSNKYILRIAW